MHFSLIRQAFAAFFVALVVSACGGGSSAPAPTGGINVVPGDSKATVTWTMEPGVQYWVFYAPVSTKFPNVTTTDWVNIPGAQAFINVKSPYSVTGLVNGFQYSFTVNGRTGDGPGGPGAPSVTTLPRPAGTTWGKGGDMGTNSLRTVTYGIGSDNLGYYLAQGDGGTTYKSTTGLTWTPVPAAGPAQINSNIYTLTRFVGVGNGGSIVTSTDLATWTNAVSNTTENLNSVTSNGALAVAVGNNGVIRTSTDGATWTAATTVPTTKNLYGVTYSGNGFWIAVGAGGTVLTSTDGTTWAEKASGTTSDLRAVTVQVISSYTFVAVGNNGAVVSSADNGTTWTAQTTGITGNFLAVSPSTSQLVAVGAGGLIASSADGVTWTQRTSGTTADLFSVLAGLSQYVVVGAGGVNINSQ
ncbi:MAG: hypothetical protein CFE43_06225 [Burkholderiales bacterium PBB3]|nr:MAG: hypothetical protein CFE43_06225 [Burkholderiales bacterium PBB3]